MSPLKLDRCKSTHFCAIKKKKRLILVNGLMEKRSRVFRKLMKLKKLARYARLEKLKANSLAAELGAGSTPRPKGIGF